MKLVDLTTYILIFAGTIINITSGYIYKTDLETIMVINIIFSVIFLFFNILTKMILKNRKSMIKSSFQVDIPSITNEELKELNKEEEFYEINPADLYNK